MITIDKNIMFVFIITFITFTASDAADIDPLTIPVLESSRGPSIPAEKGYFVDEIRDGVYWVTNGAYQSMFMTTGKGVVVFDAPLSIGANLIKAIKEVTNEPVTHLVYSHSHKDHIGAAGLFGKQMKVIAHQEVSEILTRVQDVNRLLPTTTFENELELTVGNKTVNLRYVGENHSSGNIFIYLQQQKILMFIDVIFPGWVPFANLGMADEVKGVVNAIDLALEYDFDTLMAGHVTRLGNKEDVIMLKNYINDLFDYAEQARQEISFDAIAQQSGGYEHMWHLYNLYYQAIAQRCDELTTPKYLDKLADVASYTQQNCFWVNMSDDME